VPYKSVWPLLAEAEMSRIRAFFGGELISLEHIGSTSVPGLAAKPIIDLLGEVRDIVRVDDCNAALATRGYQALGEYGTPGRRYFFREENGQHTHHLHVFATGDGGLRRHLALRDFLRTHPEEASAYGALKTELARCFPADIEAYMDGKDGFVRELERRALAWCINKDARRIGEQAETNHFLPSRTPPHYINLDVPKWSSLLAGC
jgi:GrpB-like predicted nucleotidyltransferase (UPF0157 family)